MLQRRNDGAGKGPVKLVGSGDDEFYGHFPSLWEFLMVDVWPGTTEERKPGSLLLFVQDGVIKGRLIDPNHDEQLWHAQEGLWELLQALDRICGGSGGEWRKIKPWKAQGRK